ncbi:hypothetical protein Esti_003104 [Eimeria stiedai]
MNAVDIGGAGHFTSFLQTKETTRSHSKIIGDILGAAFAPPPAVKLQLTEVKEPDPQIKEKMDEIEQLRTDEETKMFEQAMAEFAQLTRITVAESGFHSIGIGTELEKNIQIQLNPFLVDKQAEGNASRGVDKKVRSQIVLLFVPHESNDAFSDTVHGIFSATRKLRFLFTAYPTVDEIVSDMQNKRDATERLVTPRSHYALFAV